MIATMAGAPISIEHVGHGYGPLAVLHDISLEIAAGSRLAVVGPSGCGKSTLLHLIAGLEQPRAGADLGGRRRPARAAAGRLRADAAGRPAAALAKRARQRGAAR